MTYGQIAKLAGNRKGARQATLRVTIEIGNILMKIIHIVLKRKNEVNL